MTEKNSKKLLILKTLFLVTSISVLSACSEGALDIKEYEDFKKSYLSGLEVSIWEYQGGKDNDKNIDPIITLLKPSLLDVTVKIERGDTIPGEYFYQNKSWWLRIKFLHDNKTYQGYVNPKYVYHDKMGKIVFASFDSTDQSVEIFPAYYSTSKYLSLRTFNSSYKSYRERVCSTLDSALVLFATKSADRGEFETKEEFRNRIKAIKYLANATRWDEKVYAGFRIIKDDDFSYDIDNQVATLKVFKQSLVLKDSSVWAKYQNPSDIKSMTFNLKSSFYRHCPQHLSDGVDFNVTRYSFGNFKFEHVDGAYGNPQLHSEIKIKMNATTAKEMKESESLRVFYGLKPSRLKEARQWVESYERFDGSRGELEEGKFEFDAEIFYIFLIDHKGKLLESYASEEYMNKYLENDIYIQEHAHENRGILSELDKLNDLEKVAKLFSNKVDSFDTL